MKGKRFPEFSMNNNQEHFPFLIYHLTEIETFVLLISSFHSLQLFYIFHLCVWKRCSQKVKYLLCLTTDVPGDTVRIKIKQYNSNNESDGWEVKMFFGLIFTFLNYFIQYSNFTKKFTGSVQLKKLLFAPIICTYLSYRSMG